MPLVLLLALMLAIAAMRVYLPFGASVEGKPLATISLGFRERLLLQRTNLYLIGVVILLGALSGFLNRPARARRHPGGLRRPHDPGALPHHAAGDRPQQRRVSVLDRFPRLPRRAVLEAVEGQRNLRMHVVGAHRQQAVKALARVLARSAVDRKPGGARAGGRVRP